MRRLRHKLTYANVVATLALFLALSGGVVYAAGQITGADIKDDSVTGNDVKESTLNVSRIVAKPHGSSHVTTSSSAIPYPLKETTWKPSVGEADAITGQVTAQNQPGCTFGTVTVTLKAGGVPIGSGSAVGGLAAGSATGFIRPAALAASRTLTAEVTGSCFTPFAGPPPIVTSIVLVVVGNR